MTVRELRITRWRPAALGALAAGLLGLIACGVGAWLYPQTFFAGYLVAWLFWLGLALGSMAIAMLHYTVGGLWGLFVRRSLEAAAQTLPLLLLLGLPLLFGLGRLFPWMRPEVLAGDESLQRKLAYLNLPFFLIRSGIYFACWLALALLLSRWSRRLDETGDEIYAGRLRGLSRIGLIVYVLTIFFFAYDWVLTLEPDWSSSVIGLLVMAGQGLSALAFAIVAGALLTWRTPLGRAVGGKRFGDISSLLLVLVMFWMYMQLSQGLIIWSGNIPEEVFWYVERSNGGWQWLNWFMFLAQFALPLAILIGEGFRRRVWLIASLAGLLLLSHLVEVFWLVIPAFRPALSLRWLDLAAIIGVGGVWLAAYLWLLSRRPLAPLHDPLTPQLERAIEGA